MDVVEVDDAGDWNTVCLSQGELRDATPAAAVERRDHHRPDPSRRLTLSARWASAKSVAPRKVWDRNACATSESTRCGQTIASSPQNGSGFTVGKQPENRCGRIEDDHRSPRPSSIDATTEAESTDRSGKPASNSGLSAPRARIDSSLTTYADTDMPGRADNRASCSPTSEGTFRRYNVPMLQKLDTAGVAAKQD